MLWGESVDRAEDAFLHVGGVCLDRLGVWAWVLPSAKCIAKIHAHICGSMAHGYTYIYTFEYMCFFPRAYLSRVHVMHSTGCIFYVAVLNSVL
jgi:hypothetical protein